MAVCVLMLAMPVAMAAKVAQPAEDAKNPPPAVALNTYQRFEIAPIGIIAPFAGQKGNEVARERLQLNLDERANPLLKEWNAAPAGDSPRTLKITPEIRDIRFITGGKRFFAGAFAGDSAVRMAMKLTDAETGEVIAEPEFYQHANAMGATYSFGATDKTMLIRITNMATEYLRSNYAQAVGSAVSVAPDIEN